MAEEPSADGAGFVAKIVKDPKNPPATLMLTGYLGASSEDKHTRLYFDPHLNNYVEIPDDAILHKQDAKSDDGLGAAHVWIVRDARLIYGPANLQRPKGTFLEGPIMRDHMAATVAAVAPNMVLPASLVPPCPGAPNAGQPMAHVPDVTADPCILGSTLGDVLCTTMSGVACPSELCTYPPQCGDPGGRFAMLQRAQFAKAPAAGPQAMAVTLIPGCVSLHQFCPGLGGGTQVMPVTLTTGCITHHQFCPGGPHTTMMQQMSYPTQWAYCTWFVCPGPNGPITTIQQM